MMEVFVVGDIIQSKLEDFKAVVLNTGMDTFWYLGQDGDVNIDGFDGDWKKIGHTKAVGTLLNVLKEG